MRLNRTSEWNVMSIRVCRELPLFKFERLDMLLSKSKVMAIWICLVLPCLTSSILIYCVPESDIRVKSYDRTSLPRASVVQIWGSRYVTALNRTSESKVMAVWICLVLPCLISSISIYYASESASKWKVMTIWISWELPFFNFEHLNILLAWIGHPSQKLNPFEFCLCFHV